MTLMQSWADSLSLLKFKSAQLFFLVTLKSIIEAYRIIWRYWWMLILLIGACMCKESCFYYTMATRAMLIAFSAWFYQWLIFVTCLSTRPSLFEKNYDYFKTYGLYFLYIFPVLLILPLSLWPTALSPFYFFFLFFFFDSDKTVKSLFRSILNSIKLVIYNYPLLFVIGLLLYIPVYSFNSYVILSPEIQHFVGAFLLPISVCTYANIYVKKLHEQFDLYYEQL